MKDLDNFFDKQKPAVRIHKVIQDCQACEA